MIVDVPDVIPAAHHQAIQNAGIVHTGQLYERIAPRAARRQFAKRTGIGFGLLSQWAKFVDLMQIRGIGPKMVRLLNGAGIKTLKEFVAAETNALHKKMRLANRGSKYSELVPSVGVVAGWQKQARAVKSKLRS